MLLDTSGLLCYFDKQESRHSAASNLFEAATARLTHNYILAEFVALATVRALPRNLVLLCAHTLIAHPDIEVVWVDEARHRAALSLLNARLDKRYSLCDAVSFVLMRQHGIQDALTTDHHFEQEGFRRLLP